MKKILFITLISLAVLTGCDDFLDVSPKTQIPADDALKSGTNVEATLISAYSDLVSNDFLGFRVPFYSELQSDNIALNEISFGATDFTGQVALRNTNILNKDVDNLWSIGYRSVARANAVIRAVDEKLITDGTSVANQEKWKAEALFVRAVAHFELMRLFAFPYSKNPSTDLGVPLRIKSLTQDEKQPRATVEAVYTQVIADLTAAAASLPEGNGNRATSWAAKGYLARVYFNQLNYQKAYEVSEEIINNGNFTLGDNAFTAFRNSGNIVPQGGVLFQVVTSGNAFGDFRGQSNRYSLSQGTTGALGVIEDSGDDDFRASETTGLEVSGARVYSRKWNTNNVNPPSLRLAEIYLINAESAANLSMANALDEAAQSYNVVRGFSVPSFVDVTFASASEALAAIQNERRIEMIFEGDRYHELRRLKATSFGEVKNGATVIRSATNYDDSSLLLKIPVSETSGNSAIVQN